MSIRALLPCFVVASYLMGIAVGILLWAPLLGVMTMVFLLAGLAIAVPLLLVAMVMSFFFWRSIITHPIAWCIFAPFLVALVFCAGIMSISPWGYVWSIAFLQMAALGWTCAAIASGVFYLFIFRRSLAA